MKKSASLLIGLSMLALSGCTGMQQEIDDNGRYWQRVDTTDAIYQRGPKAQQMLFQDMSACTSTLNEMERLGAIRHAVPPETFDKDANHIDPDSPKGRMARWDTPDRNGYLRTEDLEYHDFETCMASKGWERTKYVNYETRKRSEDDYLDAIGYQRFRSKTAEAVKGDYDHLNK